MSIQKAVVSITSINILGLFVAVINSIIIARYFGTSREIEIYFSMSVLIRVVMKLSQGGEMSEIILPVYHKYRENSGLQIAQRVVSIVFNWYALFMSVIILAVILLAPSLVKIIIPGFSPTDHLLGIKMIRVISPLFVFMFINGQLQSILNAEKIFGKSEIINLLSRVLAITAIIGLVSKFGVWAVVISLWISTSAQFTGLMLLYYSSGNKYYFILKSPQFTILHLLNRIWSTYPYIITTQIWNIILNAGLSTLPQGTLAIYTYIRTLLMRLQGVFMRPLSIVFFTHYSERHSRGDLTLKSLTNKALGYYMLVLFPILLAIVFAGESGLGFIWGTKNFTVDDVNFAHKLLMALFSLLFISGITMITRKVAMTAGYVTKVYFIMSVSQVVTAAVAWYAIQRYGIYGVVFTNLLNVILLYISTIIMLLKRKEMYVLFYDIRQLSKWIGAFLISCLILDWIPNSFQGSEAPLTLFVESSTISLISVLAILVAAYALRISSVRDLAGLLLKYRRRHFV